MNRVYITCRSQTEALLASRLLSKVGIHAILTRPPREDRKSACAFGVRIREEELERAELFLHEKDFPPYTVRILPT